MTSIANTLRDLLSGHPVGSGLWVALAWCVAILVVAYAFASLAYRHKLA